VAIPDTAPAVQDVTMQTADDRPAPIRLLVVDRDDRVRESLERLVCIGDRIEVAASAADPVTAIELAIAFRPDVAMLDPRLPDIDEGLDLIRQLRTVVPGTRILVCCSGDSLDRPELTQAADAVIRKTYRCGDLVAAVTDAAGREPR
jgi:DNA-binding NarL/FixJ family response regulator